MNKKDKEKEQELLLLRYSYGLRAVNYLMRNSKYTISAFWCLFFYLSTGIKTDRSSNPHTSFAFPF